jgi:hypothetical protein
MDTKDKKEYEAREVAVNLLNKLKQIAIDRGLIKDINKSEDLGKSDEKAIGTTRSGKPIHNKFDHPAHKDFTIQDHHEAALAHGKLKDKHLNNTRDKDDSHSKIAEHHGKQMWNHMMARNKLEDANPSESFKFRSSLGKSEDLDSDLEKKEKSAKFERCVMDVKEKQGGAKVKGGVNPWAVCHASVGKSEECKGCENCKSEERSKNGKYLGVKDVANIKGVHRPLLSGRAEVTKYTNEGAKKKHKKVLGEIKNIKPSLPKSEDMGKDEVDKFQGHIEGSSSMSKATKKLNNFLGKIKAKREGRKSGELHSHNAPEKGVHQSVGKLALKGVSRVGQDAHATQSSSSMVREDSKKNAKQKHQKVLNEMKNIKPNLPKSEDMGKSHAWANIKMKQKQMSDANKGNSQPTDKKP